MISLQKLIIMDILKKIKMVMNLSILLWNGIQRQVNTVNYFKILKMPLKLIYHTLISLELNQLKACL